MVHINNAMLSWMSLTMTTLVAFVIPRTSQALVSQSPIRAIFGIKGTSIRMMSSTASTLSGTKGKLLVLGGTGYLGQTVCKRAIQEGYVVTSLSRRPPPPDADLKGVQFSQGDARDPQTVANLLQNGPFVGVVHCIGLLFDDASGLGQYNRLVSGSGSVPDAAATYDAITRVTAFNAIDAAINYAQSHGKQDFPFVFTSAAEAGWPEVTGGPFVEKLVPNFLHRYLIAKRAVEGHLLNSEETKILRSVILRPSLIYSMDRPASFPAVGAFFVANRLGLPFVDRPVSVQMVANAIVRAVGREDVRGVQRYPQIDALNE